MNETEQMIADLKVASRFLLDDGFSVDSDEAIRIGMFLSEMAGMITSIASAGTGTNADQNR